MMIDRYAASKYTEAFPGDMYPASHSGSNVSVANDNQDYKVSREENETVHVIRPVCRLMINTLPGLGSSETPLHTPLLLTLSLQYLDRTLYTGAAIHSDN